MLGQLLSILVTVSIGFFVIVFLTFLKIAIPTWRFYSRKVDVSRAYKMLKGIIGKKFDAKNTYIEISLDKYKIKFSNHEEMLDELERIAKDALNYYEKMGWINQVSEVYHDDRDELILICTKVDTARG